MKLIIINGPPGVGKSTLAKRLHTEMPMSLLVEADDWRRMISAWQEHRVESQVLNYSIVSAAVSEALRRGTNVIVDKAILTYDEALTSLEKVGADNNAEVYEFLITATLEAVLQRAQTRGYRPESILNPEMVTERWHQAETLYLRRPTVTHIDTTGLTHDAVYEAVRRVVLG
ncbi:MAG: AAA family ATPase [Patescibacteria group bacterium]